MDLVGASTRLEEGGGGEGWSVYSGRRNVHTWDVKHLEGPTGLCAREKQREDSSSVSLGSLGYVCL